MTPNPCTICKKPGIPGLIPGRGKCQYHYNVGQFGRAWADECEKRRVENNPPPRSNTCT